MLKTRGSRVRTSVWPKFYSTFENTFLGKYCQKLCHNAANRQLWYGSKFNVSSIPRYGTRRAQIPRKPLDPPTSWIVTQSLIYITSYFLGGGFHFFFLFVFEFHFREAVSSEISSTFLEKIISMSMIQNIRRATS